MKQLIEEYVTAIKEAYDKDKFWGQNADKRSFAIEYGRKFAKVTITSWGQTSVHCFVEISTGDIYKAATWSAPAKGKRGNIQDLKRPVFCGDFYR